MSGFLRMCHFSRVISFKLNTRQAHIIDVSQTGSVVVGNHCQTLKEMAESVAFKASSLRAALHFKYLNISERMSN